MLKIDKYYDVRCDICGMSRSVDLDGGLGWWERDATSFRKKLKSEGWRYHQGKTICPKCTKKSEVSNE